MSVCVCLCVWTITFEFKTGLLGLDTGINEGDILTLQVRDGVSRSVRRWDVLLQRPLVDTRVAL